jgi:hypothetical protein
MNEHVTTSDGAVAAESASTWRLRREGIVALLYVAAFVVWEATAMPALVALVICAKLAVPEIMTGWWLRRFDPDWRRGRVCFWFHLSYGLWKMAVAATALVLTGIFVAIVLAKVGRAPFLGVLGPMLRGAVLTAGAGYGLSFLATYVAMILAWRHGVRVWLGKAQHLSRRQGFWPPRGGGWNKAPLVGLTTLILTLYFVGTFGAVVIGMTLAPRVGRAGVGPMVAFTTAGLLVLLFVVIHLFQSVHRHFFAEKIEDCWPEVPEEVVLSTQSS